MNRNELCQGKVYNILVFILIVNYINFLALCLKHGLMLKPWVIKNTKFFVYKKTQ